MLRSFDYAVAWALDERAAIHCHSRGALEQGATTGVVAPNWHFIAGYRTAIGDCPSFPRNEALFNQSIEIIVLERRSMRFVTLPPIAGPQAGVVEIIGDGTRREVWSTIGATNTIAFFAPEARYSSKRGVRRVQNDGQGFP
jgi:hypothetical protein